MPQTWVDHDPTHSSRRQERGEAWMALDAMQTVAGRREWYRDLIDRKGGAAS